MAILLMEPSAIHKRRRDLKLFSEPTKCFQPKLEDAKQRLKAIRDYSLDHFDKLVTDLTVKLTVSPYVRFSFAQDADQVVEVIKGITDNKNIVVNKSAVVTKELMPAFLNAGFNIIESYYDEFKPLENRFNEYWQLPDMTFESRFQSFDRTVDLVNLRSKSIRENGTKDFMGMMGVNAISAEDGSIVMLQHMNNISKIFKQAEELVLVAGLDKIVSDIDDA